MPKYEPVKAPEPKPEIKAEWADTSDMSETGIHRAFDARQMTDPKKGPTG